MSSTNKVVNANQNLRLSWIQNGHAELIPFIEKANWLINKHCTEWWKNHPETADYQLAHFSICLELSSSRGSRERTLRFIAIDLKCNPLLLINDSSPELKDVK